ncbi:hypothetical protein BDZ89DRAFT_408854 [Hymenopellis radicata]|nr:hypothetical protein BDZ89DRAFT_408854 [Hymenopellis radicata]
MDALNYRYVLHSASLSLEGLSPSSHSYHTFFVRLSKKVCSFGLTRKLLCTTGSVKMWFCLFSQWRSTDIFLTSIINPKSYSYAGPSRSICSPSPSSNSNRLVILFIARYANLARRHFGTE